VELFRNVNIDWLGKKWYLLTFSLIFSVAGLASMFFWHGVPLGVDFKGGTLVYVKFTESPSEDAIRAAAARAGLKDARIQRYGDPANNEVLIGLEQQATSESALDAGKNAIIAALEPADAPKDKKDLNNAGFASIRDALITADPLQNGGNETAYGDVARAIVDTRDKVKGGVLRSADDLKGVVPDQVLSYLKQAFYAPNFAVRNVEIVGPQVGEQLRSRALWAIGLSLAGMLVYLWFRFELVYGVAAVVAVFHDTLITVGAFSLLNKEISLTVVAAILTLTGYSMNDTIVVFDRIRENVKLMRRESFAEIVNRSINQTLSRTILTSGLTFLTVLSLYLFGGEVLHGFSFALVVGILIGTYSSIAVAAPMLVAYMDWRARKSGRGPVAVASEEAKRQKVRVKA
jgi:preprotein translocase subunit SecF